MNYSNSCSRRGVLPLNIMLNPTRRCLRRAPAFCYVTRAMAHWLKKRLLAFLLPAVLAFAQHAAMAHLVSHAGDNAADPEQTLIHLKLCDKCATAAKLLHVSTSQDLRIEPTHACYVLRAATPNHLASADCTRYPCRDPPTAL